MRACDPVRSPAGELIPQRNRRNVPAQAETAFAPVGERPRDLDDPLEPQRDRPWCCFCPIPSCRPKGPEHQEGRNGPRRCTGLGLPKLKVSPSPQGRQPQEGFSRSGMSFIFLACPQRSNNERLLIMHLSVPPIGGRGSPDHRPLSETTRVALISSS